jgi:hypothetical protein
MTAVILALHRAAGSGARLVTELDHIIEYDRYLSRCASRRCTRSARYRRALPGTPAGRGAAEALRAADEGPLKLTAIG